MRGPESYDSALGSRPAPEVQNYQDQNANDLQIEEHFFAIYGIEGRRLFVPWVLEYRKDFDSQHNVARHLRLCNVKVEHISFNPGGQSGYRKRLQMGIRARLPGLSAAVGDREVLLNISAIYCIDERAHC